MIRVEYSTQSEPLIIERRRIFLLPPLFPQLRPNPTPSPPQSAAYPSLAPPTAPFLTRMHCLLRLPPTGAPPSGGTPPADHIRRNPTSANPLRRTSANPLRR